MTIPMKRLLAGALCAGLALSLAGCGGLAAGPASPTPPASSGGAPPAGAGGSIDLNIGKALALATTGVDAAVNAAELAHKGGALTGANWQAVQAAAKEADALIDTADAAYLNGDIASAEDALAGVAATVDQIKALTAGASLGGATGGH